MHACAHRSCSCDTCELTTASHPLKNSELIVYGGEHRDRRNDDFSFNSICIPLSFQGRSSERDYRYILSSMNIHAKKIDLPGSVELISLQNV